MWVRVGLIPQNHGYRVQSRFKHLLFKYIGIQVWGVIVALLLWE